MRRMPSFLVPIKVTIRVDMERLDRFGQQVGQRFVGDRTDRDLPDRLPQQPAAVGSDPDNILVTVLQQRKTPQLTSISCNS